MADFSVWNRATLEQFAREATAKLVENRKAIDELALSLNDCVEALTHYENIIAIRVNPPTLENARASLAKHVQDAQKTGQSC